MTGFSDWVKYQLTLRLYTDVPEAARALKLRPSELSRWISAKRPPTQDTIRAACRVFDAPVLEVLIAAGYLSAEEAGVREDLPAVSSLSTQDLVDELCRRLGPEAVSASVSRTLS
ncbi:helix-turn-helix domain-containing protein [Rhodococcus sp. 27YEA15]|uniref:helix-turn-helix domain-containing protein n=1 Tax=Rhodococcus sp. 27YEA15 TaxID=3156259 RepID=UPI003C79DB0E